MVIGKEAMKYKKLKRQRRFIHHIAACRKKRYTPAERKFEEILRGLGEGVLQGKYKREHVLNRWILDFYLYEVGLGIEIDGGYHRVAPQMKRDREKAADCEAAGIVLVRFSNQEVFGNRERLTNKLREAYREAQRRSKGKE